MEFKELETKVLEWAKEKGILDKATPLTQMGKTLEEVNELKNAVINQALGHITMPTKKGNIVNVLDEIEDGIGDSAVTLMIQAEMQGTTLEKCLEKAYNVISKRNGKMIGGVFVKSEDLE